MKLLVVDDDPLTRDGLAELFRDEGHTVSTAGSVKEALAAKGHDVALVDVVLPDGSGLEVVARLRAAPGWKGAPIFVMTGFHDEDATRRAIEAGATDFLKKPVDPAELVARVEVAWRAAGDRERAVAEAERRYRTLFEVSAELILVTSGLTVVDANPAAEHAFGLGRAQLCGKSLVDLSALEQQSGLPPQATLEALAASAEPGPWTARGTRRSTLQLETVIHGVALEGILDARLVTARDMTRQRALESQLQQAQRMESLGLLAGGVAHDFNNMLTAMIGYLELALAAGPDAVRGTARLHLQEVRRAADRACDLARQLLAVGKQKPAERRALNVDELLRRCSGLIVRLLGEGVKLDLDLGAPDARILGDPSQLEQVFMNLAINARDAMPGGGDLRIATEDAFLEPQQASALELEPGRWLVARVSDTGIGMSDSLKLRIFEPFFTTKADKGTGLGLSIVHAAVEQHGGAVAVDSAPGHGTTFRVYLPVSSAPEAQESTPGPLRRGSETILVVEDDPVVRDVLLAMLETLGYHPIACERADDGVRAFEAHRTEIAAVITDAVMPDKNGIDLEKRLRQLQPGVKTVLVSGYRRAESLPPNTEWLEKPVSIHRLAEALFRLLGP